MSPASSAPVSASIYQGVWDSNQRSVPPYKLSGVAQTSLSLRRRHLLRGVASTRRSGDRTDIVGERTQRHQPLRSIVADLRVCKFSARKVQRSRRARVRIPHVRPSAVGVGAGDTASSFAPVALARTVAFVARRRIRSNE